ncbi:COG0679 Predicted permeases [Rhabdaerophilaceae bacterium]
MFDSLLSIFLVIGVGYGARRWLLGSNETWTGAERVTYFLLFPALMIHALAGAKLESVPVLPVAGALLAANLVMCLALLLARTRLLAYTGLDNPAFTSIFQGVLRWNAFVGLAIAGNLYGAEGVALASVALAFLVPVLNVQSVFVLRLYGNGAQGSMARGLLTNPFIISAAIGLALNFSGLVLPKAVMASLDMLGRCALGLGLLLVGAGLKLQDLTTPSRGLVASVILRLVVLPAIGGSIAALFGLGGAALGVVVICLAVPSAGAAYILARQMGGDAGLMAAILTAQTLASFVTLPMMFLIFRI